MPSEQRGLLYGQFVRPLLDWFSTNGRSFPWRGSRSPYEIAVAEILLQKTAAANVVPIYNVFIESFPTVDRLAQANVEDVLAIVRPLGLPRRARLLVEMSKAVVDHWGGDFPRSLTDLREIPGLGPYGAAAVASLAMNHPAPMIDINVMRIAFRVFGIPYRRRSGPSAPLRRFMESVEPRDEAGAFNLSLLDLGALVCHPRKPNCGVCPLARICQFNLELQPS